MNQDKSIEMMICYYGKEGYSKSGIMYCKYQPELQIFEVIDDAHVGGKINFILWDKEQVLVPVADGNQTGIKVFSLEDDKLNKTRFLNTEYFYSYGVMKNKDYGYFSSFSSGVDAIIDFHKDSEIDTIEYEGGKSHYINLLNDGRIYALDNGNDMLYIYQDNNKELEIEKKISFGNESPRLMPLHPNGKRAYLLMQRTNQIVVFDTEDFDELQRIDIPGATIDVDFCGGIFVDKSGTYVCATIRVKNEIALFKIDKNGLLIYLDSQSCGEMPRDLTSEQEYMFITCSYSNRIEVMKIENDKLVKQDAYLEIDQPITFANKENI